MSDAFDEVKKFGSAVLDKTGDAAHIAQYKAKMASRKTEIEHLEKKMGRYIYDKVKEEGEPEEMDAELLDLCHAIDALYDEIAILESKIDMIKDE